MDNSYHYLLMVNQAVMHKQLLLRLKGTGLTLGQPKILDYLKEHDGVSQREIAQGCHIEAATLTSLLNRMEENGLIERRMLNGNRRSFYIFLTNHGQKMQQVVEREFTELEALAFQDIPREEKENFMRTFDKIYSNMTEGQKR